MKNTQNIFDNNEFFESYRNIRKNPINYNNLLEQPALKSLLPNLTDKSVLDMGCGAGEACLEYINRGASKVIGIDLSEKMLELARRQANHEKIEYLHMDMCDIKTIGQKFDVIVSSLAFHYVENFHELLSEIQGCLHDNGILLFSQEHPLTTAPFAGPEFTWNESGKVKHYNLDNYGNSGIRSTEWMVEGVIKYHRTFSQIVNELIGAGFAIERMSEPLPDAQVLSLNPNMIKEFDKPSFLIIRSRKE